jgi:hypothetical protein
MPSAFGARLGALATVLAACSCTALLGLDGKQFGGAGGAGGASSSTTTSSGATSTGTTSSGTTSSSGGPGGGATTSSSSSTATTCPGADLMNDPLNCGRCSHDCLGGACLAGACQPVAVVQGQGIVNANYLAIDTNWVYFVTQLASGYTLQFRGVHDLPGATTGSLGAVDGISALAAADGYVGWTTITPVDGGTTGAASALMAQGSPTPKLLYQGAGTAGPMVGHGQYLSFAANQQSLATAIPGAVSTTVAAGGVVDSLAADASHLYWMLSTGAILAGDVTGNVPKNVLTDVGARLLATREGDPNLYWILQAGLTASIRMAPKTGGALPTTIGSPAMAAQSVAVDAEAVYVASLPPSCPGTPNGRIQRIDLATQKETLLPGAICPFVVVADDVCIYWTDPNLGGLVRLAK